MEEEQVSSMYVSDILKNIELPREELAFFASESRFINKKHNLVNRSGNRENYSG
jgi:hypothetical protein